MIDRLSTWASYKAGMTLPEIETVGLSFKRKEWDLGGEQFIGLTFSRLIPILLRESRFSSDRFTPPSWIGNYQGGIWQANFKVYGVILMRDWGKSDRREPAKMNFGCLLRSCLMEIFVRNIILWTIL